ncbi:hypothetical protein [Croceitalea rosinachiae]|uniref:Lipoprotein n=1 Tax=Croceitalea rosinachiae TaxID=3075596 RepID=A0ABU3ACT0_9FLAO|nr:hypothetical protein [Croceitalea sp. F388]MDT0607987.1 hypothetical protein [Croceitalea sp. F388]
MNKVRISIILYLLLLVIGCTEKDITFLISENSIGRLTSTSEVEAISSVFLQDSIVRDTLKSKIGSSSKKIQIFEKGGLPLLLLTPSTDSIPTIENVQILDPRYKAENGIGLLSTFKDIQSSYTIKKIVTTLNSVVIFPKNSNLYFTIDKAELPTNLRYTTSNIEAVQIPNGAKIKYLMLGWD